MKRKPPGYYVTKTSGGETVKSFVPTPLPPDPPLSWTGHSQQSLEKALLALGRLDTASIMLPNEELYLYFCVRKEAVLSSQIEGTQSSLSDLLLFELDQVPQASLDEVAEVSSYIQALEHGLQRIQQGFPLCNRLFCEIHSILLSRGRGREKNPGEFRRSQNWIGGTRPGNAAYVPPPHTEVAACMGALESFLHAENDGLPMLVRAGLAHVQFETIHPFLDGNGRMGRLLITLMLCNAGILRSPLLYLSLFLKQNRDTYYSLLGQVRRDGDWEKWLSFFLVGVWETAENAYDTFVRLSETFTQDRGRIGDVNQRSDSAARVHQALMVQPIQTFQAIGQETGLSRPTVYAVMRQLEDLGIVHELRGRGSNRLFAYSRYLSILSEGTEPL